jgi:hypothetical protein
MADQSEVSTPPDIVLDPETAGAAQRYAIKWVTEITLYHATRQEKINDWILAFSTAILVALFVGKASLDVMSSKILAGLILVSFIPGIWAKLLYLQPVPNAIVSQATKESFDNYLKNHPSAAVPQFHEYLAWYMRVLVNQKHPFFVRLLGWPDLPEVRNDDRTLTQKLVKNLVYKTALVRAQYLLVFLGVVIYGLRFLFSCS